MSVWFLRKNNKVGFLEQILNAGTLSMTVEDMWYGNTAQDRSLPRELGSKMMLVLWGKSYSNPSSAPDKEIIIAEWSGTGFVYTITSRGVGETTDQAHYIGDNVALLWTAEMSSEICIFDDILKSGIGSIGYLDDLDVDGCNEVIPLIPDDEVSDPEGYKKILVSGGADKLIYPYWQFAFATEVGAVRA